MLGRELRLDCRQPLSPHGGNSCPLMRPPPSALYVPSSSRQRPPERHRRCDRASRPPRYPLRALPCSPALDPSAAVAQRVARPRPPAPPTRVALAIRARPHHGAPTAPRSPARAPQGIGGTRTTPRPLTPAFGHHGHQGPRQRP